MLRVKISSTFGLEAG